MRSAQFLGGGLRALHVPASSVNRSSANADTRANQSAQAVGYGFSSLACDNRDSDLLRYVGWVDLSVRPLDLFEFVGENQLAMASSGFQVICFSGSLEHW